MTELLIQNSCLLCSHELTCGYSPLATLGRRTEQSAEPCPLGERSYGGGPFFAPKTIEAAAKVCPVFQHITGGN